MESQAPAEHPAGTMEPGQRPPSLPQRIGMVFFAPTRLGEALRDRSPWFWTLTIVAVVSAIIVLVMPADLLLQAAQQSARGGPDAPQPSVGVMRGFGVGGALLGLFVGAAVVAGALYIVFNLLFGLSEIQYKQHLSVVAHAWWITLLQSLILFPLQIAQGDATLRLGFGLLLGGEPQSFLGFFLQNVTIFGIWASIAIAAMEAGLSRGKLTMGKGATVVLILYLIFAAVMGALQSLGAG